MRKILILFSSSGVTFSLMLLYELAKEYFFKGSLTLWQSHFLTIFFTTLLSFIVTLIAMNKIQSLENKHLEIELKEEKIKSIKQVMYVAHHYINNLANNLGLVQLEAEENGVVCQETLKTLQEVVEKTAKEMRKLGDIEDPYDEKLFKIDF